MSLNQFTLSGRLTSDPKIVMSKNGKEVAVFTVAQGNKEQSYYYPALASQEHTVQYIKDYCRKADFVEITGKINSKQIEGSKTGYKKNELGLIVYNITKTPGQKKEEERQAPVQAPMKPEAMFNFSNADGFDDINSDTLPF